MDFDIEEKTSVYLLDVVLISKNCIGPSLPSGSSYKQSSKFLWYSTAKQICKVSPLAPRSEQQLISSCSITA